MYDVQNSFTFTESTGAKEQAITASAASVSVLDLGTNGNFFKPAYLHIRVTDTFTADGAATMAIDLQSDSDEAFGSPATLQAILAATGKATFVKGYHKMVPLPLQGMERFSRLYFTVATGPMTAGKIVAYINDAPEL